MRLRLSADFIETQCYNQSDSESESDENRVLVDWPELRFACFQTIDLILNTLSTECMSAWYNHTRILRTFCCTEISCTDTTFKYSYFTNARQWWIRFSWCCWSRSWHLFDENQYTVIYVTQQIIHSSHTMSFHTHQYEQAVMRWLTQSTCHTLMHQWLSLIHITVV